MKDEIKLGNRVRKLARRDRRCSGVLGTVIELFECRGKSCARIRPSRSKITSVWPVKRLAIVIEEEDKIDGIDGERTSSDTATSTLE